MVRIAINGFGRIGRSFLRVLFRDKKALESIEVVAINVGPDDPASIAYVFTYDSIMGTFDGTVSYHDGTLTVNGKAMKVLAETAAERLPWEVLQVDWVVDCSGYYTRRDKAELHLISGAKNVLISAPAQGVDCSIVPGVNMDHYKKDEYRIVSLGSCTTNALMPMLQLINETWGLESALVTTTHAYTNTQSLLDGFGGKDVRKERAAAINIIPTSTGAQKMVDVVLPELKGKVAANALRVPVANVSLVDVTWVSKKSVTSDEIHAACAARAEQQPKIFAVTNVPLVSTDYYGNGHSVTVDTTLTMIQGNLARISGWYDNEWGYSERMKDFLCFVA